jgi:hypothetical protein
MPDVTITGEDAVTYLIDKYSWNIYGADYDRLNVIAYRQLLEKETGAVQSDYRWESVFSIRMCIENFALIQALLRDETYVNGDWYKHSWYEYDSWGHETQDGTHNIILDAYRLNAPFRAWFDNNIVDYVMGGEEL